MEHRKYIFLIQQKLKKFLQMIRE